MTGTNPEQTAIDDAWLLDAPRMELGFLPTPLIALDRLSERLRGPRLWLKRDDCTGLATGGNKTRKLEYLLADARRRGADIVVTFGAVQSNHARQTAAACAVAGLSCHLILTRRVRWPHPAYEGSGNVLLDRLLGATVELVAPEAAGARTREVLDGYRGRGLRPYVIPTGGSNPVGALGYARCALELLQQSRALGFALTDVMHASSSAGTQAGLLAGFAGLLGPAARRPVVHGINVYAQDAATLQSTILDMARAVLLNATPADVDPLTTTSRPGIQGNPPRPSATIGPGDVHLDSRYLGEDYGIPTAGTLEAIRLLASSEGILLDPVYSGKGFAGLVDRVRSGEFSGCHDLVFIHTGGTAVLPVYDQAFTFEARDA